MTSTDLTAREAVAAYGDVIRSTQLAYEAARRISHDREDIQSVPDVYSILGNLKETARALADASSVLAFNLNRQARDATDLYDATGAVPAAGLDEAQQKLYAGVNRANALAEALSQAQNALANIGHTDDPTD